MIRRFALFFPAAFVILSVYACGGSTTTSPSGTGGTGATTASSGSDTSASNSASASATTGSGGTTSSSASGAGGSGGSGGGPCNTDQDCMGFSCCAGACVNEKNDIFNCGKCGNMCSGGTSAYCDMGTCGKPPCNGQACPGGGLCCAANCCMIGEICCDVPGPQDIIECTKPDHGTCPMGCIGCVCASPDTPIATPWGERAIADLAPGDLVYSVDGRVSTAVAIKRVGKVAAHDHHVVRVTLETGRVLEISPKHPLGDGRTFADLRPGDRIDGVRVAQVELIPYAHPFTYDILPDSDTGSYVAGGVLIGSTLRGQ